MSNERILKEILSSILELDKCMINDDLIYQKTPQWDSINHMFLISELENVFGIEIESDDILEIKTYPDAKNILSKYGIEFKS